MGKKVYYRPQGDPSRLPYAVRTGLRQRQRRQARLLLLAGVLVLAVAVLLYLRDTVGGGGQPAAPATPPPVLAIGPEPANVSILAATIDITRDVFSDTDAADAAAHEEPAPEHTAAPAAVARVLPQYQALYTENPDLVGWLRIEGTDIDHPVVQIPGDNTYYMRRGFDRFYASGGTLFLDGRCRMGWTEQDATANWLLYGHNLKNGSMFGTLDRYADEEFYLEHPTFTFDTLYEQGQWQVVAALYTKLGAEELPYYAFFDATTPEEWQAWMDAILPLALYETGVQPQYGQQLLTLSTCGDYKPNTDSRFAVLAIRSQTP